MITSANDDDSYWRWPPACLDTRLLRAQTPTTHLRRVGVLAPSTQAKGEVVLKPFFDQMRELSWVRASRWP